MPIAFLPMSIGLLLLSRSTWYCKAWSIIISIF